MEIEKKRDFIIRTCWLAIVCFFIYIAVKLLGNLLLPFVIGFMIASVIKRPVEFLHNKTKLSQKPIAAIILTGIYLTAVLIVFVSGNSVYEIIVRQIENVPVLYTETIVPIVDSVIKIIKDAFPYIEQHFDLESATIISESVALISKFSTTILAKLTNFVTKLPSILMGITFAVASSFFFALDYSTVTRAFLRQFSPKTRERLIAAKDSAIRTLKDYFRVYGIIIVWTFTELVIGFSILKVKNLFGIALGIALVDIFPIVGTGTFLIPWGIILCLLGNFKRGIAILILYYIITIVRQILEPRIVGKRIGIHPALSLFSIYLGGKILGIFGIIILPISFAILKNWNDEGIIALYK